MKQKRIALLILTAMLLSGCQPNPNTGSSQTNSQAETESSAPESSLDSQQSQPEEPEPVEGVVPLDELTASLGDAIPSNLDCSECVVRIPESMEALYRLEYIVPVYHAYSQNESLSEPDFLTFYDHFQKQIAFYFPDETFDESLVHVSSYDKGFVGLDTKGEPDSGYPTLQSTYEKIADGTWDFNMLDYRAEGRAYLWCNKAVSSVPVRMNRGVAIQALGVEAIYGVFEVDYLQEYQTEQLIVHEDMEDAEYKLKNGMCSLKDAVAFFEGAYYDSMPFRYENPNVRWDVDEVGVYQLTDDMYGYGFFSRVSYCGVPFDRCDPGSYGSFSDGKEYDTTTFAAFMTETDNIDFWAGCDCDIQITPIGDAITEILPPSRAVEIAGDRLTAAVTFQVQKVELIYQGEYTKKDVDAPNRYDTAYRLCKAVWKLTAYNPNDDIIYNVYVDAVSGDICYRKYLE